jgi:hypothetical protein
VFALWQQPEPIGVFRGDDCRDQLCPGCREHLGYVVSLGGVAESGAASGERTVDVD